MWMYGWYRPTNKHLVMKYTYKTTTNSGEQSIKGTIAERSEWWCLAQHIIVFGRIFYIYSRYLSWWYMYRLFKSCGGNTTVLKCTDMLSNKPTTLYTSKLMVSYDLPRQQLILAKFINFQTLFNQNFSTKRTIHEQEHVILSTFQHWS